MNTPVSFEIAKLLKEKGFDKLVVKYYHEQNPDGKSYSFALYDTLPENRNFISYAWQYSAPTIAEVVIWLHEKHGIWVSVKQIQQKDTFTWEIVQSNEEKWHSIDWSGEEINSPKEAYEAAIEWVLKELL